MHSVILQPVIWGRTSQRASEHRSACIGSQSQDKDQETKLENVTNRETKSNLETGSVALVAQLPIPPNHHDDRLITDTDQMSLKLVLVVLGVNLIFFQKPRIL
jgi:hypothetical protein